MNHRSRMRTTLVLLTVSLLCVMACFATLAMSVVGYTALAVDEYIDLVDKETLTSFDSLPERPTEDDWYALGLQVLQDNHWQVAPNLTSMWSLDLLCSSSPTPSKIAMHFADSYLEGPVPSVKHAEIIFDRTTSVVQIHIYYAPVHWGVSQVKLTKLNVDLYEALALADAYGGADYRQGADDGCVMSVRLTSNYRWIVKYGRPGWRWEDWEMVVDAVTGDVHRHDLP